MAVVKIHGVLSAQLLPARSRSTGWAFLHDRRDSTTAGDKGRVRLDLWDFGAVLRTWPPMCWTVPVTCTRPVSMSRSCQHATVGAACDAGGMDQRPHHFIESRRWQYARTMPDWPHEYTVKDWKPEESAEFVAFCQVIQTQGSVEPWPPPPASPRYLNRYLVIGAHKYWAMGPQGDRDPVEEKTVINRACLDPRWIRRSARASRSDPGQADPGVGQQRVDVRRPLKILQLAGSRHWHPAERLFEVRLR